MERNVIKITRHYEDGSTDYIEGISLDNYKSNIGVANGLVASRSYIQFLPVEWTFVPKPNYSPLQEFIKNEQQYGELFEKKEVDFLLEFEDAIKQLEIETEARNEAFVKAYNDVFDEPITIEDLKSDQYEDLQDLAEYYHQVRNREK